MLISSFTASSKQYKADPDSSSCHPSHRPSQTVIYPNPFQSFLRLPVHVRTATARSLHTTGIDNDLLQTGAMSSLPVSMPPRATPAYYRMVEFLVKTKKRGPGKPLNRFMCFRKWYGNHAHLQGSPAASGSESGLPFWERALRELRDGPSVVVVPDDHQPLRTSSASSTEHRGGCRTTTDWKN